MKNVGTLLVGAIYRRKRQTNTTCMHLIFIPIPIVHFCVLKTPNCTHRVSEESSTAIVVVANMLRNPIPDPVCPLPAWAVMGVCAVSCSWATTTSQYQGNDGYRLYDILIFLNKHGPWIRRCLPCELWSMKGSTWVHSRGTTLVAIRFVIVGGETFSESQIISGIVICVFTSHPSQSHLTEPLTRRQAHIKMRDQTQHFSKTGRGIHSDRPHGPRFRGIFARRSSLGISIKYLSMDVFAFFYLLIFINKVY